MIALSYDVEGIQFQVFDELSMGLRGHRGIRRFDFKAEPSVRTFEDEIYLPSALLGVGEAMLRSGFGQSNDLVHAKTLPRMPRRWMGVQAVQVGDPDQRMRNAGVSEVYGWRFSQPFADIDRKRREDSQEISSIQHFDMVLDGLWVDAKHLCGTGVIPGSTCGVSQ